MSNDNDNNNMALWDKVKTPPQEALKEIKGGRLKGKSDISPQWRYQVMTENFGMCGVGWKYEVTRQWLEEGDRNQKVGFVNILLYIKEGGEWSDPIPGSGGSMFINNESGGLYTSDEVFKMATTDALSVAMKMLGVAADVYAGVVDSKYNHEHNSGKKPVGSKMSEGDAKKVFETLKTSLHKTENPGQCSKWWKDNAKQITTMPKQFVNQITGEFGTQKASFFIDCPKDDPEKPKKVLKSECDGCDMRDGCPSW